jgi:hypothetical protein
MEDIMNELNATPEYVVFSSPSVLPKISTISFNVTDFEIKGLEMGTDPAFFERHNPSQLWQRIPLTSPNFNFAVRSGKKTFYVGTYNANVLLGDTYQLMIAFDSLTTKTYMEIPPSVFDELNVINEIEITTIREFSPLTKPALDVYRVVQGATYMHFDANLMLPPRLDIWLVKNKIQLNANGFFDPNLLKAETGIGGQKLFVTKADAAGIYKIEGRYPSKTYHAVALFRDADGSYFYLLDFEDVPGGNPPGVFKRTTDFKLLELKTINDGDPNGESTVKGHISVDLASYTKTWQTSLTNSQVGTDDNTLISLGNGNLGDALSFPDLAVDSDPTWTIAMRATMIDIDGWTEDDEVADLAGMDGLPDTPIYFGTNIGIDESKEIVKILNIDPINAGDDAQFLAKVSVKPIYASM